MQDERFPAKGFEEALEKRFYYPEDSSLKTPASLQMVCLIWHVRIEVFDHGMLERSLSTVWDVTLVFYLVSRWRTHLEVTRWENDLSLLQILNDASWRTRTKSAREEKVPEVVYVKRRLRSVTVPDEAGL